MLIFQAHLPGMSTGCLAFSPDGRLLASGSHDRTTVVWDLLGEEETGYTKHRSRVEAVAFSPDGGLLASAAGRTIRLLNPNAFERVGELRGHTARVTGVAFSP